MVNKIKAPTHLVPAPNSPARLILGEVFGYSSFRPGQEEVIANILLKNKNRT